MPKSKSKQQKAALSKALIAAAPALSQAVSSPAKKKKKKSGGFLNLLGGAAKMAAELAPVVLPLLMGSHAPTMRATASSPAASSAALAAGGVPLAANSCATCTGMYGMKAGKGKDGRVTSVRVSGMDYLGEVSVDGEELGTVLSAIDLNPFSGDWGGTMLQRQASLFERYRPHKVAVMVEASCPATTQGQIISYVDPDPDDVVPQQGGRPAIQSASAHEGADISQVWQTNCAGYAFDSETQDFYADADGSDNRLISPGTWRVLANTQMPAATVLGSLYVIWDYEFKIPQIEQAPADSNYARLNNSTGPTDALPFGTGTSFIDITQGVATFDGQYAPDGAAGAVSQFYAFPEGSWLLLLEMVGTSSPTLGVTVDGGNFQSSAGAPDTTLTPISAYSGVTGTTGIVGAYLFHVNENVDSSAGGYIAIQQSTGAAVVTGVGAFFIQLPSSVFPKTKLTLQDYEKKVGLLETRFAALAAICQDLSDSRPAAWGNVVDRDRAQLAAICAPTAHTYTKK